jgi:glycyl-tRNA synthetase beta chain
MSTMNVLFELGTEELPASCVDRFPAQLELLLSTAFASQALTYAELKVYTTPRRIVIYLQNLLAQQADQILEKQGPHEKAAFNDQKEPTPAGLGFARSCNIDAAKLSDYCENGRLVYRFTKPGTPSAQLLPELFTAAINSLQAGKTMRWGSGKQSFVRAMRWALLMIDDQAQNGEIFDLPLQNFTYGHRFLAPEAITITHANSYLEQLMNQGKVIVDQTLRREKIIEQLHTLPKKVNGTALIDENLVTEVMGIVEWPVALIGSFSAEFLNVPAEALISSMKHHQKSFPLVDANQKLLPYFIFISNLASKNPEQVIHGNERVMHARLSDAAFFFNVDKQHALAQRLPALSSIVYQEQLGSLYDKTQRVVTLCEQLGEVLQLDSHDSVRVAWLSLCDLTTTMVQEFPELQGIMGNHYANFDGEPASVCTALAEQYLPRFAADQLPDSLMGSMLAIAHRLDTLTGQFAIGNKPTGDKDPFALRRAGLGLLRILIEKQIDLDLKKWINKALQLFSVKIENINNLSDEIWSFCVERLRSWYLERGGQVNSFIAVAALNPSNPYDFYLRLQALEQFRHLSAANALIAAHKRVKNILERAEIVEGLSIQDHLLQEPAEQKLAAVLNQQVPIFQKLVEQRDYVALLTQLADLRPYIDNFFDHVMVMVEDPALRENRLILLTQLRRCLESVAEIGELISN